MKRYIIIICSLFAAFIMDSCSEDFLEVESPNKVYLDDYYTTESRIFEALVAAYDPLGWFDYSFGQYNHLGLLSDVMSDDVYVGGNDQNDQPILHTMFNYSVLATKTPSSLWTCLYSGINRANSVIENMDKVTGISEANKQQYLAEAKVLRSFYYTWLWKMWGNIPYYEVNLTFPYVKKQSAPTEVYQGIVTTLEQAIEKGGLPMRQTSDKYGRVTLAMAYMLYAEVVMYQNDDSRYNTALSYMEKIIGSGQYGLVDYAGIWESTGEWGLESIFEINYFSQGGKRDWGNPLNDGGSVYPILIGVNGLNGSPNFAGGWGFEPVRAETYNMYDPADKRRDGGILNIKTHAVQTGATYSPRYQDEGFFLKKYIARTNGNAGYVGDANMNHNNNFRVYRYAETLLNASELIARGASGEGTALGYLGQVRGRAGVGSVPATLDNILDERHLEFVGEGKRYWDLIRSGKASTVLVPNKYRTKTWSEKKKYLPIPQSEIEADGNLVQNPYED